MRTLLLASLALLLPAVLTGVAPHGGISTPVDAVTGATDPVGDSDTPRTVGIETFRHLSARSVVSVRLVQQAGTPRVEYTLPAGAKDILRVLSEGDRLVLTVALDDYQALNQDIEVTVYTPDPPEVIDLQGTGSLQANDLRADHALTFTSQGTGDVRLDHVACAALEVQNSGTGDFTWNKAEVQDGAVLVSSGTGDMKGSYLRCGALDATQRGTGRTSLATLYTDDAATFSATHSTLNVTHAEVGGTLSAMAAEDGRIELPRIDAAALTAETRDRASLTIGGGVSGPARFTCDSENKLDARRLTISGECTTQGRHTKNLLLIK